MSTGTKKVWLRAQVRAPAKEGVKSEVVYLVTKVENTLDPEPGETLAKREVEILMSNLNIHKVTVEGY